MPGRRSASQAAGGWCEAGDCRDGADWPSATSLTPLRWSGPAGAKVGDLALLLGQCIRRKAVDPLFKVGHGPSIAGMSDAAGRRITWKRIGSFNGWAVESGLHGYRALIPDAGGPAGGCRPRLRARLESRSHFWNRERL